MMIEGAKKDRKSGLFSQRLATQPPPRLFFIFSLAIGRVDSSALRFNWPETASRPEPGGSTDSFQLPHSPCLLSSLPLTPAGYQYFQYSGVTPQLCLARDANADFHPHGTPVRKGSACAIYLSFRACESSQTMLTAQFQTMISDANVDVRQIGVP